MKKSKSSKESKGDDEKEQILTARERYARSVASFWRTLDNANICIFRRKSYDASRSRAASPLPDVSSVKSTGYGVVDR